MILFGGREDDKIINIDLTAVGELGGNHALHEKLEMKRGVNPAEGEDVELEVVFQERKGSVLFAGLREGKMPESREDI